MADNKFEQKHTDSELAEVIGLKPLTGVWWKYGLALSVSQLMVWYLLGYSFDPQISLTVVLKTGYVIYGSFIGLAFLPFIFGRLGFKRLMWFNLVGLFLGISAYYLLALFEPTRRFNLLPFISFLQLTFAGLSIGVVWEFGRYVYRKLRE